MVDTKKMSMKYLFALILFVSTVNADPFCNNYCCETGCFSGYVSYENVILRPHFTRNNAYFLDNPNSVNGQNAHQFKWDYNYSPRIVLGLDGFCGVGLRGRYWCFNHKENIHAKDTNGNIATWFAEDSSNDIGFNNSTEAKFSHDMDLRVADLETTFDKCDGLFFVGGRYAHLKQAYRAENVSSTGKIKSHHSFEGYGLTTGLNYLHPIMCDFSLYVKGRVSLLYGDSHWKATNADNDAALTTSSCRDVIPVSELQLGIDWRTCFCDSKVGFIRLGIEAQHWGSAGAGGPGCNAVFDEGNYQNSHPQDASLGFIGFNLAFGVIF